MFNSTPLNRLICWITKHDPVFHEMGYPVYNEACWVCTRCYKYLGNNYKKGLDKNAVY